jgi:uncharacterized protein DUF6263
MKLVISIALLTVLGCEKSADTPTPDPGHDGVQLVTLGDGSKQILRYRLRKGTKTTSEMAMTMDLDIARAIKMPTIVMTLEIAVDDVLASGAARVSTRITGTKVVDRPGTTMDAATLAPVTQQMTGLGYAFTLSPDGSLSEGRVTGAAAGDLQAQLGQMTRAIEQVAMRLPPVPVGVGATWSAKKTVQQNGLEVTTVTTTHLTAIDGDQMTFTSQTTLSAPNQQIVQQGMAMDVKDVGGGGKGQGTVDLTTMAMRGELTSEFRGRITAAGQQPTAMNVTMQLTLK